MAMQPEWQVGKVFNDIPPVHIRRDAWWSGFLPNKIPAVPKWNETIFSGAEKTMRKCQNWQIFPERRKGENHVKCHQNTQ